MDLLNPTDEEKAGTHFIARQLTALGHDVRDAIYFGPLTPAPARAAVLGKRRMEWQQAFFRRHGVLTSTRVDGATSRRVGPPQSQ
jgi:hypothetical protein